jgi:hypothetical protein
MFSTSMLQDPNTISQLDHLRREALGRDERKDTERTAKQTKIVFSCPVCQMAVRVEARHAGKKGMCPYCKTAVPIPKAESDPIQSEGKHTPGSLNSVPEGRCSKCHRNLSELSAGAFSGDAIRSMLDAAPYPCKSCGTVFCRDCMREIMNSPCPRCGGTLR